MRGLPIVAGDQLGVPGRQPIVKGPSSIRRNFYRPRESACWLQPSDSPSARLNSGNVDSAARAESVPVPRIKAFAIWVDLPPGVDLNLESPIAGIRPIDQPRANASHGHGSVFGLVPPCRRGVSSSDGRRHGDAAIAAIARTERPVCGPFGLRAFAGPTYPRLRVTGPGVNRRVGLVVA